MNNVFLNLELINFISGLSLPDNVTTKEFAMRRIDSLEHKEDDLLEFLRRYSKNLVPDNQLVFGKDVDRFEALLKVYFKSDPKIKKLIKNAFLESIDNLINFFSLYKLKCIVFPKIVSQNKYNEKNIFLTQNELIEIEKLSKDSCLVMQMQSENEEKNFCVDFAFEHLDFAFSQIDRWPAIMLWDSKDLVFIPLDNKEELKLILQKVTDDKKLTELKEIQNAKEKPKYHYIFHLSDLHIGAKGIEYRIERLLTFIENKYRSLGEAISADFVITGDMVDSPYKKNQSTLLKFIERLKKINLSKEPVVVLGNHDINVFGLSFFGVQKKQISKKKDFPNIKFDFNNKIILLLFNSNMTGKLARGHIGNKQRSLMGNKIEKINQINDYLLIAILHHHISDIKEPEWLKESSNPFISESLKLTDEKEFNVWLTERKVNLVLHGHKHIPFVSKTESGITVVACGSSVGKVKHKDPNRTYMSYNLIKVCENKKMICQQFVEAVEGGGLQVLATQIL